MSHTSSNLFAKWTKSGLYHATTFSPIIAELVAPFTYFSALQQRRISRLCNIKSCEITNKHILSSSPTEFLRDLFLVSLLTWPEFVKCTKLQQMKDEYDPDTFEKLNQYNNLCNIMTFEPLQAYFDTNPTKFTSDMNFILDIESSIYNYLCKMTSNANTCMVVESRHMLQKTNNSRSNNNYNANTNGEPDEEDDTDPEYQPDNERISVPPRPSMPTLKHTYTSYRDQSIHKPERLELFFSGFIGFMSDYEYEIPKDIINTFILFTYGWCFTIDRFLRENILPLNPEPFSCSHYNINWDQNEAELVQVHNSKVHNEAIENRLNLYHILNSVHSDNNVPNSMTWLYIKYEDIVMIYMYITDENGKSYGIRLINDNIKTVVPSLFVRSEINVSLDGFKPATDPTLDEYRLVLFKNDDHITTSQTFLSSSFQERVQDIINDYNDRKTEYDALLALDDILTIFKDNNINQEYFMEADNHRSFMALMSQDNIKLDIINAFWYGLGGSIITDNIDIDSIMEEESNSQEIDLDELNEAILSICHGEDY